MCVSGYLKAQSCVTERQEFALRKGRRSGPQAVTQCTHTHRPGGAAYHTQPAWHSPLLPGLRPARHITALSTAGNCKMMLDTVVCVSKLT